jgi:hypothetical protein
MALIESRSDIFLEDNNRSFLSWTSHGLGLGLEYELDANIFFRSKIGFVSRSLDYEEVFLDTGVGLIFSL